MFRGVLVQLSVLALANALVTSYHLDPKTAAMSGKAHPVTGVSEVITCNFDELDSTSGAYCELFTEVIGDTPPIYCQNSVKSRPRRIASRQWHLLLPAVCAGLPQRHEGGADAIRRKRTGYSRRNNRAAGQSFAALVVW